MYFFFVKLITSNTFVGSRHLFTILVFAGIAGVFTIFSSFVFSIAVINMVGSDLTGLK